MDYVEELLENMYKFHVTGSKGTCKQPSQYSLCVLANQSLVPQSLQWRESLMASDTAQDDRRILHP